MNGALIEWADATVHVGAHGLHYGTGVFEGIRCYATPDGPAVFRLTDHLQRLSDSASLLHMEIPYTLETLRRAHLALVDANGLESCYLRPIAFFGLGDLGVAPTGNPIEVAILAWPWGAYLGEDALTRGVKAAISSWRRVGPNTIPHVAKATGVYLNSMLATTEARLAGYDEAILLTEDGYVADGPGENIFVIRNNVITTPPLSTSILPGITRDTIIKIAAELGYRVQEQPLIRSDLYRAHEIFFTGTAAEVTPVRVVDGHEIGLGELTRRIQRAYLETVQGKRSFDSGWLDYVRPVARQSCAETPAGR